MLQEQSLTARHVYTGGSCLWVLYILNKVQLVCFFVMFVTDGFKGFLWVYFVMLSSNPLAFVEINM